MNWALYAMAGWSTLGTACLIWAIGKPRKPVTPGTAVFIVAVSAVQVVVLVLAARRLA